MKRDINFPILGFSQTGKDSRFTKLRVKVMHDGVSKNPYNFSLPVISKAQPSLKNIPMLAFVKKTDGAESADFAGHEFEFKITKNGIETVYLGRPIGMIPETNNYTVKEEEGKHFVYCDAYIWNDYANEALEILQRDGYKKVSMEAKLNDYTMRDDGIVDVYDYSYTGVCLLGEDVEEAMSGAHAQVVNSMFAMDAVSAVFSTIKEQIDATIADFEEVEEPVEEEEIVEEIVEETIEETVEEDVVEETVEEEAVEEVEEEVTNSIEDPAEEVVVEVTDPNAEFTEVDENKEENDSSAENNGPTDELPADNKEIDFAVENENLKTEILSLNSKIEALENENQVLKADLAVFRSTEKEEAVAELFAQFPDLDEEELGPIKEKALTMELSELEVLLFAARGKKIKFEVQDKDKNKAKGIKFSFDGQQHTEKPIWADLVEKHKK